MKSQKGLLSFIARFENVFRATDRARSAREKRVKEM